MDYCRFLQVEPWSVVTALAEIRVLVNGTRNETGNFGNGFGVRAENEGE